MTQPGRTAIEQQVTSAAIRACVQQLDTSAIDRAHRYQLSVTSLEDVDREWVRACLQDRLFRDGIRVTTEPESTHRIEAVVAFAGADSESTLIGIPLFVPGLGVSFGDISVYKSKTQTGRAKLALHVWSRRELTFITPEVQDSRYFKNETFLTFFGSFINSDLQGFRPPGAEERHE